MQLFFSFLRNKVQWKKKYKILARASEPVERKLREATHFQ